MIWPNIRRTYTSNDQRFHLYTMAMTPSVNVLRNAICAYGEQHGRPDDAYLLARGLMYAMINEVESVDLSAQERDLILLVIAWANEAIDTYRNTNATEIAEFERDEQRQITDIELLGYALTA